MLYILVAVVAGILAGYALGGRFANLAEPDLRLLPLLWVGIAVQVASLFTAGVVLLVASYALLLVFAAANLLRPGMGLVLVGIAMNATVIAVNGGMPVRASAIESAGIDAAEFGTKHHLETPDDKLTFLGDIIPVPIGPGEVLSFGDLVLAVGVADVIVHLMRRRSPRTAGIGVNT